MSAVRPSDTSTDYGDRPIDRIEQGERACMQIYPFPMVQTGCPSLLQFRPKSEMPRTPTKIGRKVRFDKKHDTIEFESPSVEIVCKPCMHECELKDELNNVSDNLVLHEFEEWILSNEEDENFEEVQVRVGRKPDEPTEQEMEEHFARNHVPFRSWCKHCIMGRAMNSPHYTMKDKSSDSITTVSLDYAYMKKRKEGES